MTALALRYRPRVFADVAGQRVTAAVLWAMASKNQMPAGLLFHGPSGTGKTTMARITGAALNCEAGPGPGSAWPCGTCVSCQAVAAGTSLAVVEQDAASFGTAADVRALREKALYGSGGEHKVFILDEAHSMSRQAYDALLKVLEEPPPGVIWVLATTEPGKVLATVAGRCSPFEFRAVSAAEIASRLVYICRQEGLDAEEELLAVLAEHAGGQVRDAVMLLEQAVISGISTAEQWRKLHEEPDFAPVLIAAAFRGDHAGVYAALNDALAFTGDYPWVVRQLTGCLRDVLVLSAGAQITSAGPALTARRDLAAMLGASRASAAMGVLWDWQTKIRIEDRRAGLDLAVAMLVQRLCPVPQALVAANGHQPGLGELKEMFGVPT